MSPPDTPSSLAAELRSLAGIALGAAVVAGLAQVLPPTRPLTHEFVQLSGILGVAALWLQARVQGRGGAGALSATTALVRVVVAGAVAWGIQLLTSTLLYDCRTGEGSVYLWVTWLPMGLFATLGGRASRRLGPWSHRGLVVALLLLDVGTLAVQGLRGLRMVDPLLGLPQLVDQRADMALVPVHAAHRLWLLGLALLLGAVDRRGWRPVLPALLAFGGLSVALGSHVGLGIGRAHLEQDLAAVHAEDRVVIRHTTDGWAPGYAPVVMERAQWAMHQLRERWGMDVRTPIELRLYNDTDHMLQSTGLRASHAGPFWVDLELSRALTLTLEHELVHAQHGEWSRHPALLLMRGVVEGSAEAWEDRLDRLVGAHSQQAAALANGDLPSAAVFMRIGGFFRVNEGNAYDAAASFVGWLILEHGVERWIDFQQHLDWDRAYGRSLEQLDTDWRAFLATVPVDLKTRVEAAERFSPALRTAYLDQTCPKVGSRAPSPEKAAETLARLGSTDRALDAYAAVDAESPSLRLLLQRVTILQTAGRHVEALALLEAERERATEAHEENQVLGARIHSLIHLDDRVALDRALAEQLSLRAQAGDPVEGLRRLRRLVRSPGTVDETLAVLRAQERDQPGMLRTMVARHPDNVDVWNLFLERGLRLHPSRRWVGRPAWLIQQHAEAVELLSLGTLECPRWGAALTTLAEVAVDERDAELLGQVGALLRRDCSEDGLLLGKLAIAEERWEWLQTR